MEFPPIDVRHLLVRTPAERTAQERVNTLQKRLARAGRLGQSDEGQLEISKALSRRSTRRVFLGRGITALAGAGAAAALVVSGIGFGDEQETPQVSTESTPATEIDGRQQLLTEIDKLPESFIKTLLQERVRPIFEHTGPFPFLAKSGNYEFQVYNSKVEVNYPADIQLPSGAYSSNPDYNSEKLPRTQHDLELEYPLNREIAPIDDPSITNRAQADGITPTVIFERKKNGTLDNGIEPIVTINLGLDASIPPRNREKVKTFENFLFLKEACSALLDILLAEEMFNERKRLGFPNKIPGLTSKGKAVEIDIVWSLVQSMKVNEGRTLAAIDVGGIFLALAALRGTRNSDILHDNLKDLANVIDRVSDIDFGSTANEMLNSTFHFSLNYSNYEELKPATRGDINLIP